ncbi:NAD(P)-dependent oxidoreductase [Microbacterium sp. MPKO10]|uniref:NAD(P)-dependent oxidoreductase n=1 Tax=Microbacterium sp. MPKO10 TaxID=2989818 RepID=UPI0022365452|nr:NAD(P)H-binding protein [Microbacterium sp. MPKO10]MCW4456881.1 NAD(P)H-binding protein [Microbacterium sp. MPKO10]
MGIRTAIIGATGMIGSRIVAEAAHRGHTVTAASRSVERSQEPTVTSLNADATDSTAMSALAREHDVLILATRPTPGDEHLVRGPARTVLAAALEADRRVVVIGGSAPLTTPDGTGLVIDDLRFVRSEWQSIARASIEQFDECTRSSADWVYVSPPAVIEPGERTGSYVLGTETLLVDETGSSWISAEDFAVMVVDQLEKPEAGFRHLTARAAS